MAREYPTRRDVIAALEKILDKDFDVLIKQVEESLQADEKARSGLKNFDMQNGTLRLYNELQQKIKVNTIVKINQLKAFYDFFTGKSTTFQGRSFVRRDKDNNGGK